MGGNNANGNRLMATRLLQGDFFQVGESIKASNFSYDISG